MSLCCWGTWGPETRHPPCWDGPGDPCPCSRRCTPRDSCPEALAQQEDTRQVSITYTSCAHVTRKAPSLAHTRSRGLDLGRHAGVGEASRKQWKAAPGTPGGLWPTANGKPWPPSAATETESTMSQVHRARTFPRSRPRGDRSPRPCACTTENPRQRLGRATPTPGHGHWRTVSRPMADQTLVRILPPPRGLI